MRDHAVVEGPGERPVDAVDQFLRSIQFAVGGEVVDGEGRYVFGVQVADLGGVEPSLGDQELQELRVQRLEVRGVEVERRRPHVDVGGVGRLEHQHATGLQGHQGGVDQPDEGAERQVLGHVEAGDGPGGPFGDLAQVDEGIGQAHVESLGDAAVDHDGVDVDPVGLDAVGGEQFEPLAPAAADIDDRSVEPGVAEMSARYGRSLSCTSSRVPRNWSSRSS